MPPALIAPPVTVEFSNVTDTLPSQSLSWTLNPKIPNQSRFGRWWPKNLGVQNSSHGGKNNFRVLPLEPFREPLRFNGGRWSGRQKCRKCAVRCAVNDRRVRYRREPPAGPCHPQHYPLTRSISGRLCFTGDYEKKILALQTGPRLLRIRFSGWPADQLAHGPTARGRAHYPGKEGSHRKVRPRPGPGRGLPRGVR